MPFEPQIPTLSALVSQSVADIDVALGVETALLDTQPAFVLATNSATMAHGNYLAIRRVAQNIVPGVANDPEALIDHARNWLGNDDGKRPAAPARLTIVGSGTTATVIPLGSRWRRDSDSALYETTVADLVFETDEITVTAIAAADGEAGWGASGNTTPGSGMTLVSEIVGLDAEWTVDGDIADGPIGGGSDEETHEALADRVEQRAQNPPRGGTLGDYEAWAREVSGVGQAWAYKGLSGPGTITIFIVRSDPNEPEADSALVLNVQEYVDTVSPAQAGAVQVVAASPLSVTIAAAIKPNTAATQAACDTALEEAFALHASAGDGTLYFDRSWLTAALSGAVGEIGHTLTTPAADFSVPLGRIPVLGTTTYSTKA